MLKGCDEHIRFVFITGVTKFSKVSIFSDLNQLNDISLSRDYADICGITEEELLSCFVPEIEAMAKIQQMTFDECVAELQEKYDGYHFHPQGARVYNPLPLLYQTGYLTIRSFDRRKSGYILCFPNQEVRYGFLDSLLPAYVPKMSNLAGTDIFSLDETGIRE